MIFSELLESLPPLYGLPEKLADRIHAARRGDTKVQRPKLTGIGRGGLPHEIVAPILMLSSRGGSFMTGSVVTVDGGRCMVRAVLRKVDKKWGEQKG